MKLLGNNTKYAAIVAYMQGDKERSELTGHEQQLLDRWMEAFSLMRSGKTAADAAAILMKRFEGLSKATAYRDISAAISLFGDVTKATKDGIKHLSTEIIREAINIARAENDSQTMIRGALAIAKVNGVNDVDPDLPDFSKLEPHTYVQELDPVTAKAFKHLIATGRIDLTMLVEAMQQVAVDTEYEDVTPNASENT